MNGAPYGRSPGGGSSTGGGGWGEYGPGVGRSGPSMGMARNGQDKVEYQFLVPSTKTGIIIGKGNDKADFDCKLVSKTKLFFFVW